MVTWPDTLPQSFFLGFTDKRQSAVQRSENDTGPANQRRRFTAAARSVAIPLRFDNEQRMIWDTFWITTLKEGSLPFDWVDPVDGSTVSFRFNADQPPDFNAVSGGEDDNRKRWEATALAEILP